MAAKPILILQMHRMGDLILSFPLFLWLLREYPGHPLWVVGEPRFYNALLPISPQVVYMPWNATGKLRSEQFLFCINLSHNPAASVLAGQIRAETIYGAAETPGRGRYVHGNWQLYRTGLIQANRHNRFHWGDLNALDCIPLQRIKDTRFPLPRERVGDRRRIGLFLGASEQAKRPSVSFWAKLAREMLRRDLRPILLGGPDEKGLADSVLQRLGHKLLNLAGRLSLVQLADYGQNMQLMITPDTGPMHLAAWTGLRVLNLSMGPVNPWETGPYQPGHIILQARISCAGCWQCLQAEQHCHARFLPRRIAQVAHLLASDTGTGARMPRDRSLSTYFSTRSSQGLYHLENLSRTKSPSPASELLGRFWMEFWGSLFGLWSRERAVDAWRALALAHPLAADAFVRSLRGFHRKLRQARDDSFWKLGPPLLRPLFSHVHLVLQNADFASAGERQALKATEELLLIVVENRQELQS